MGSTRLVDTVSKALPFLRLRLARSFSGPSRLPYSSVVIVVVVVVVLVHSGMY
jgi:hypothetical protein